ncbi:MAG: DUF4212 domain-containing protein [Phycisphaeraceae bacterium]|nr:DUF4212 domain-containing protein [Phycisphaeraceae bacterium]
MSESAPSDAPSSPQRPEAVKQAIDRYWSANICLTIFLLLIWAAVGLGCGILLADWLNQFKIGGYPLGFWFAQQGSILVFVLLILIYATAMNWLDRRHPEELERLGVLKEEPAERPDHEGENI